MLDENQRSIMAAWSGKKGDDLMRFVVVIEVFDADPADRSESKAA